MLHLVETGVSTGFEGALYQLVIIQTLRYVDEEE